MLLTLALALLVIWGIVSLVFHAVGGMIHLLLALAVIFAVVHFVRGKDRGARV